LKREYPTQPIVGVGAVILNEGKILLVRRGVEPGKGRWSIPGGAVELGEKVREATIREAREESGLDVEIIDDRPLDAVDSITTTEDSLLRYHYVLLQFVTRPRGGTLKPGSDALEAKWVSFEEVERYDLTKSFRAFFQIHKHELKKL